MFKNLKYANNNYILIIDGTNLVIRSLSIAESRNLNYIQIALSSIVSVLRKFRPNEIYVVFDGQNSCIGRRAIFEGYKQNRRLKKYQFEDYIQLYELIKYMPVILLRINNIEGDDVIAHIALTNETKNNTILIYSSDQDFFQLCSKKISIYSPNTKLIITESIMQEKYQCYPANFPIIKAIIGDDSDNIPGLKGVGMKTLLNNFHQLFKYYQPIQGDLTKFKQILEVGYSHNKLSNKILNNFEEVKKYYKLVNLRNGVILNPQLGAMLQQTIDNKKKNLQFNKKQFLDYINKLNISNDSINSIYLTLSQIHSRR